MTHIVAVSPHLDDAAFSVGGLLAARARAGDRITIITCFTGNVARPAGFALACQLDKGLPATVDYMALRRNEDLAACAVIGATAIHLPLLEAPHRGYDSAPALFAKRHADDTALARLVACLAEQLQALAPDLLLGPLAIGDHVDHWLVRDALEVLGLPVLMWEDWPYMTRTAVLPSDTICRQHRLSEEDRHDRIAMCAAYSSQLPFQFGSAAQMETAISTIEFERLHAKVADGEVEATPK